MAAKAQIINFCGEPIPMEHNFLNKFMDISERYHSREIVQLKARSSSFFPFIESTLKKYNIPDDFKYLAIVESGLRNVTSPKQAKGIWQIMLNTAIELGLEVNNGKDERDQFIKSTLAASELISRLHQSLGSWSLAAAAYNGGINTIKRALKEQGELEYYKLKLNAETEAYLYKVITVKLLFESGTLNGSIIDNPFNGGFINLSEFASDTTRICSNKKRDCF